MQYREISSKATFLVKGSPGKLRGIQVTAAGTSWTFAIYDAATAGGTTPVIATAFTLTAGYKDFGDLSFSNGLVIVSGGTTAGTATVIFE